MRLLIAAFVLMMASGMALATDEQPNFNTPSKRVVPNPIPPDFNECVRVFPNEKARAGGVVVPLSTMRPPLTPEMRGTLQYVLDNDWGEIRYCEEERI